MAKPDFPGALWIPAHSGAFYTPEGHGGVPNKPRAWCLHTPEEPVDNNEVTPTWFQNPASTGSTHYYISGTEGRKYQMVEERCFAFANGLLNKPWPSWADTSTSLNWQTLSVEIEGFAASIHNTLIRGGGQWNSLVELVKYGCDKYNIPRARTHIIGHYQVASNRSDPGLFFPWDALIADLNMGTEDEMEFHRWNWTANWFSDRYIPRNVGDSKHEMQALYDFGLDSVQPRPKALKIQTYILGGRTRWFDGASWNEAEETGWGVTPSAPVVDKIFMAYDSVHNGTVDFRVEEDVHFALVKCIGYYT